MKKLLTGLIMSSMIATNVFAADISTVNIKVKNSASSYEIKNDGNIVSISRCKNVNKEKDCIPFAETTYKRLVQIQNDLKFEKELQLGVDAVVLVGALVMASRISKVMDLTTPSPEFFQLLGLAPGAAVTIVANHLTWAQSNGEQIDIIKKASIGFNANTEINYSNAKKLNSIMNKLQARIEE